MIFGNLNNLNMIGGLGTGGSGSFSPNQISGLQLWIDATSSVYSDAGTTPATDGATVQQWNDLSGNSRNVSQATATNRPTYNTSILNGKPVITFDGVDNFMGASTFTLAKPEHVFIVFRQVTWTSGRYVFDGNTSSSMAMYQGDAASPSLVLYAGAAGATTSTLALNTFAVVDTKFEAGSSHIRLNNGTAVTGGGVGAASASGFRLGSNGGGGPVAFSNIQVAEVLVYNSALSDANATLVNRYLGAKWGITVA